MLSRGLFSARVRSYALLEREGAYEEALQAIEALADPVHQKDRLRALGRLREGLVRMDLRSLGWPPQGSHGDDEDLLHADNQKMVSAVLRFDHRRREAQVLLYVVKGQP